MLIRMLVTTLAMLPVSALAVDLVFHHAAVYTVNEEASLAEAVAIEDSRVVAVGKNADVLKLAKDSTKVIHLKGQMILPKFPRS